MNHNLPIKRILLAPMEGVLDGVVRQLLTSINEVEYCVTEFVRVTQQRLPHKTFYRLCPELYYQGKTASGTPVRVQLLGQHPQLMAENASTAIALGSYGIDINAGCPAKTVVGSEGGAYLLKDPELIYQITKQVRSAVPADKPVSVKIRLGWQDKSQCIEIADAVAQGGADEITVHGRTKEDGYNADKIDWQTIGLIKQNLTIPVIANGEIFSVLAAKQCIAQSHCQAIMLGRGILAIPNLANMIRYNHPPLSWNNTVDLLLTYAQSQLDHELAKSKPFYHSARIKQWLTYLKATYPDAMYLLQQIRTLKTQSEMINALQAYKSTVTDKNALTEYYK
ncbi:tRNA dihydrouridine(16) synthase DusC [Candidatus Schmidhempelia bombi]|uniref:tRNA-dihydrouridine(16) synthase n=1 Tax=Candidatus Schmidhempelia bombi str. Bimp TaxID=1387197 RepID=A0AB94IEA9_9GAMM|nr:tRNA dihydrouridine(16) synthase DusC [Candidatus Schmidhempelia bombi]TEA27801.1 tRNA dihydrouridine(16) synthase DusC [Candidatus Schmidhempelia bombi str. Bimp]